ncbi:Fex2p [Sugiyamaella lignohabitans]|uniref:Fex2p n=1 Tax=Sugiyamaella lignohabitans TaxID=796027 RepID=A0A167BX54_9ASCO|nr:Fex2p [Sugiyamaella lignohabitans]ANB10935.1 Fex2p [Sugiyamaella lignohabitans]
MDEVAESSDPSTGSSVRGHVEPKGEEQYRRFRRHVFVTVISNKYIDVVVLHLLLAFFGITGVLARVGLTRLTSFPGSQNGGVLWSNFGGCLLMGILVRSEALFGDLIVIEQMAPLDVVEHGASGNVLRRTYTRKEKIPLYIGLATGVCGSITSFSTFMIELFQLSALQPPTGVSYPNPGYGVMAFLSYLIITLTVSFGGYFCGFHVADGIEKFFPISLATYTLIIEVLGAMLGLTAWVAVIVLAILIPQWRYWTFACIFGPFGVYARFWSARLFNKITHKFLVGTFIANMIATAILCALIILQRGQTPSHGLIIKSKLQCQAISALQDGFCGNFSTISSFIAELVAFRSKRNAYIYGGISIGGGFSIVVVILGSYAWTRGISAVAAC